MSRSKGTAPMAGKTTQLGPQGMAHVTMAVNDYGSHFDHPGCTPIGNIH